MSAEDRNKAHLKRPSQSPGFLGFRENPFNKAPFSPLLENIADERGLDLGLVRGSLTVLARAYHRDRNRQGEAPSSEDLNGLMQEVDFKYKPLSYSLNVFLKSNKLPVAEQRRYIAAMGQIGEALEEDEAADHWSEYLAEELNSAIHRNDGERSVSPTVQHLTIRTYEAFAAKKKKIVELAKMVGIEEVEPQGYPSDSLSYGNVRGNRTRRHQQWSIVQATETNKVNKRRLNIPPAEPAA